MALTTDQLRLVEETVEQARLLQIGLSAFSDLLTTDNLKYLTRAAREDLIQGLLSSQAALEDSLKALIRESRTIRRVRLQDDEQLVKLIKTLSADGYSVDELVGAAAQEPTNDQAGA